MNRLLEHWGRVIYKRANISNGGENMAVQHDQELDACGLNCPLPILRAKKTLNKMSTGDVLKVVATDPGSVKDFEAFSRQTGNELLESREEDGKFLYLLRKG